MHVSGSDSGNDRDGDRQARGIDQQMPLSSLHTFVRIVAADAGRRLNGLRILAVYDRSIRVRVATDVLTLGAMQCGIEPAPGTIEAKASEMLVDCLPRTEVGGHVAPGAASAQDVKDGVEDAAQLARPWSATTWQRREIALDAHPLRIRETARIGRAHGR